MKPDTPSHPPGLPNLGPLQEPGTPPPPAVPPLMATALQAEPEPLSPAESLKLSLGAVPPRVCVIGPKGGGKTIYRLYLANQLGTFPSYLARMFGTEASPWGDRPGEELTFPVAGDAFRWEEEATLRYHTDRHDHYLPAVRGTNWITRHRIDLPFLQGDSFLLDFPGVVACCSASARELRNNWPGQRVWAANLPVQPVWRLDVGFNVKAAMWFERDRPVASCPAFGEPLREISVELPGCAITTCGKQQIEFPATGLEVDRGQRL